MEEYAFLCYALILKLRLSECVAQLDVPTKPIVLAVITHSINVTADSPASIHKVHNQSILGEWGNILWHIYDCN